MNPMSRSGTVRGVVRRPSGLWATLVGVAFFAAACSRGGGGATAAAGTTGSSTSTEAPTTATTAATTTTSSSTTTTKPETVTTAPVITPGPNGLIRGMTGPAVQQLRQRLANLRFDVDPAKASYDSPTYFAVVAFQKQQNLPRTGKADQNTLTLLAAAGLGAPMLPNGEPTRIEIDLKRQVLQYWIGGRLTKVLPVSTGSGQHYCVPASKGGGCAVAVTPGGSFRVNRKILGQRISKLGELYNPMYFNGGIAIHGEPAVPNQPASHGCVRIPMNSSLWMFNSVTIGTPVYVLGGKAAPVPFNELAPPDPAAGPSTPAPPPTIGPATTTTLAPTKPPGFPI